MLTIPNSVLVALELLRERKFSTFAKRCAGVIYERRTTYGLRRDLRIPFAAPKAKIPITVRELREADAAALFDTDPTTLDRKERIERTARHAHYKAAIDQCYVAVDERDGRPCYCQWLMGPDQNAKIQAFFPRNWFPILNRDEALLENAYTPASYRGNGIMPSAMALIAERAAERGGRYVITFVETDNIPSLRGCRKAGFAPNLMRTEHRLLFGSVRIRSFSTLPDGFRPAGFE